MSCVPYVLVHKCCVIIIIFLWKWIQLSEGYVLVGFGHNSFIVILAVYHLSVVGKTWQRNTLQSIFAIAHTYTLWQNTFLQLTVVWPNLSLLNYYTPAPQWRLLVHSFHSPSGAHTHTFLMHACVSRWSCWVSAWGVCLNWLEACLPSWCNRKHDGFVSQRYRLESHRGDGYFFRTPSALSFVFLWHTHTHTHTHTLSLSLHLHLSTISDPSSKTTTRAMLSSNLQTVQKRMVLPKPMQEPAWEGLPQV